MLYFAFGSNTNRRHMMRRCPDAKPLGKFWFGSARLVFRGVADCVFEPGSKCPGVLWRVSQRDIDALDRYEGVNVSEAYRRLVVPLRGFPGETSMFLYVMNSTGIAPPSIDYVSTIREGYRDFGLPLGYLDRAIKASWDDKSPSIYERRRFERMGRPRLARSILSGMSAGKTGSLATGNAASISKETEL